MLPSQVGLLGGYALVADITTNQVNYNLRQALGNPPGRRRVFIRIRPGVEITSTNFATPAFNTGDGWAPGTEFIFSIQGGIYGAGGQGGNGGTIILFPDGTPGSSIAAFPGFAGGTALRVTGPATISNGGEIFGGGGGGGGGQAGWWRPYPTMVALGGTGGSGGAGRSGGSGGLKGFATIIDESMMLYFSDGLQGNNGNSIDGGARVPGVSYNPGTLILAGSGGRGGGWGVAGEDGGFSTPDGFGPRIGDEVLAPGGAAGKAVDTNGFPITWVFGLNSVRVKGPVS